VNVFIYLFILFKIIICVNNIHLYLHSLCKTVDIIVCLLLLSSVLITYYE